MTQEPWRDTLERFVELTEAWTQEEVALLDGRIEQKDVSRWKRGDYKRKPSGPKMAAINRVVGLLESGPGDYERGLLDAADELEMRVRELRARAGVIAPPEGSRSPAALAGQRARQKGEKKRTRRKAEGGSAGG